jgi:hypothetical protein
MVIARPTAAKQCGDREMKAGARRGVPHDQRVGNAVEHPRPPPSAGLQQRASHRRAEAVDEHRHRERRHHHQEQPLHPLRHWQEQRPAGLIDLGRGKIAAVHPLVGATARQVGERRPRRHFIGGHERHRRRLGPPAAEAPLGDPCRGRRQQQQQAAQHDDGRGLERWRYPREQPGPEHGAQRFAQRHHRHVAEHRGGHRDHRVRRHHPEHVARRHLAEAE